MLAGKVGFFKSSFDPRSLSGLAIWLDAALASTFTLNGTLVSQWNDRSGNGRNAAQATASLQPSYETFYGSIKSPAAIVSGTAIQQRVLPLTSSLSVSNNVSGLTLLAVSNILAGYEPTTQGLVRLETNAGTARAQLFANFAAVGSGYSIVGRRLDSDAVQGAAGGTVTSSNTVLCGTLDYANRIARIYVNGTQVGQNTSFQTAGNSSATNSTNAFVLPTGNFWYGAIAEACVYNRALSATEVATLSSYAKTKWGIT